MRVVYSSTCPQFHDTRKISKDKWAQITSGATSSSRTDRSVTYSQPYPTTDDTKNIVLGKILQENCDAAANPQPPSGPDLLNALVAYWKMEELSGAGPAYKRLDSVNGYDLLPFYDAERIAGKINFASSFNGDVARYLYNNDIIFISDNNPLSILGWVMVSNLAIDQTIAGSALPSLPVGWRLWYRTSDNRFVFSISSGGSELNAVAAAPVAINTWYHVAGVLSFANIACYVNGVGATTVTGAWPDDTAPSFRVASDLDDNVLTGRVDELAYYFNRSLTAAEVQYWYNGGTGRSYPP